MASTPLPCMRGPDDVVGSIAPFNRFEIPLTRLSGAFGERHRLARFEDTDGCPECMIGRLVLIVGVLFAAGLAWILLPVDAILATLRQM